MIEREFPRFGLTDASVILASREKVAVLTDDLALYLKLLAEDVDAMNFNHVRRLGA